jgi:hypothetical protein
LNTGAIEASDSAAAGRDLDLVLDTDRMSALR